MLQIKQYIFNFSEPSAECASRRKIAFKYYIYIFTVCDKMMEGAQMMIVDYHPTTYGSVQSYAHYLNLPTLVPGGTGSSAYDPYKYDISLLPPTIGAIVAVIKHFHWNNVVYYIFDTNDGRSAYSW
jgi:hypothetical protein